MFIFETRHWVAHTVLAVSIVLLSWESFKNMIEYTLQTSSKLAMLYTTFPLNSLPQQSLISAMSLNSFLTPKEVSFNHFLSKVSAAFKIAWVCSNQVFLQMGSGKLTMLQNFWVQSNHNQLTARPKWLHSSTHRITNSFVRCENILDSYKILQSTHLHCWNQISPWAFLDFVVFKKFYSLCRWQIPSKHLEATVHWYYSMSPTCGWYRTHQKSHCQHYFSCCPLYFLPAWSNSCSFIQLGVRIFRPFLIVGSFICCRQINVCFFARCIIIFALFLSLLQPGPCRFPWSRFLT